MSKLDNPVNQTTLQKRETISEYGVTPRIPNLAVTTHEGHELNFYEDLIQNRIVIINFLSIAGHEAYPVMQNLANVQKLLGTRLGRYVSMISITLDPVYDTAEALARFANQYDVRQGWHFISGSVGALSALKATFFRHDPVAAIANELFTRRAFLDRMYGQGLDGSFLCSSGAKLQDCTRGLLRYGNDRLGLWGAVPAKAEPAQIVERLDWIQGRPPRTTLRIRRGGPYAPKVA